MCLAIRRRLSEAPTGSDCRYEPSVQLPADGPHRPNNKVKTSKALQGKKGAKSNSLHPKSRRAKQVARVSLREEKIAGVRCA